MEFQINPDESYIQVQMDIADDYEHAKHDLEYVLENVLQEESSVNMVDEEYLSLCEQYNSILINKCNCSGDDDCTLNSKCCHATNYKNLHSSHELVLDKERHSGDIIYECSTLCKCNLKKCRNRLVQYGPRQHLKIIDSLRYNSKGLLTIQDIPQGGFICEYAGELLTTLEAQNRTAENEKKFEMNYILCLNELNQNCNVINDEIKKFKTIVDPSRKGNIGRYLNHSCEPNCEIFSVRIDCPIPKIGESIFQKKKKFC